MSKPLETLRRWILSKKEIDSSVPGVISCDGETIDLSTSSGYIEKKFLGTQVYSMEAIWLGYINTDNYSTYYKKLKAEKKQSLVYTDLKYINQYLNGEIDKIEGFKNTEPEEPAQPAQQAQEPVSVPKPIPVAQKPTEVPSLARSVEKAPVPEAPIAATHKYARDNYDSAKKVEEYELIRPIDSVLLGDYDFSNMIRENGNLRQPKQELKSASANSSIIDAENSLRAYKHPILIVPLTDSCRINITNIEEFLCDSKWSEPAEGRNNRIHIKHTNTATQKMMEFDIVTNTNTLQPGDWNHVAGIFLSGFAWQLKDIKMRPITDTPQNPDATKIFNSYLGIYVKFKGDNPTPDVQKWKVKIYDIDRNSRHLDAQIVSEIWMQIEQQVARAKKDR